MGIQRLAARSAVALVGILAMPVALAEAGALFELETTTNYGDAPETETAVMAAQGKNLKMDIAEGAGSDEPDQIIFLGDRREILVIDNDERSYMVMDQEAISAMRSMMGGGGSTGADGGDTSAGMEAMLQEALKNVPEEQRAAIEQMMREQMQAQMPNAETEPEGVQKVEYRNTGASETKEGYPATKYEAVRGDEVIRELWITDWDNVDGGEEAREAFHAMAAFWNEAFGDLPMMEGDNPVEIFEQADGFPVVVREFSNGELDSESVLRKASERDFDPADFEPPAGYERKEMGM